MVATLPYADLMTREEKLQRFFLKAEAWGWRKAFAALSKNSLLIADSEVITALKKAYRALPCKIIPLDDAGGVSPADYEAVYCLCLCGEYQRVKQLRAAHADAKIISLTYDVMPRTVLAEGRFPSEPTKEFLSGKRRRMIVALSGADVDYLSLLFEQNGKMRVNPTLGGALYWWCSLAADVRPLRIIARYVCVYPKGILSFDGNLLYLLLQHQAATQRRLSNWLSKGKASLLYLNARDKCRIAVLQGLLDDEPVTSLWQRSKNYAASIANKKIDLSVCHQVLQEALSVEAFLEVRMSAASEFKIVTLEEFIGSADIVYPAIATFFEHKGRHKITGPDWLQRYKILPNFLEAYEQLRRNVKQLLQFVD